MYISIKSAKILRETLDRKYKVKFANMKKLVVNEFMISKLSIKKTYN